MGLETTKTTYALDSVVYCDSRDGRMPVCYTAPGSTGGRAAHMRWLAGVDMYMPPYRSKLIVLRGNSGSGKSATAKALRAASTHKIAIVEQDYLRRFVLKEKDRAGGDNIALIEQVTEFALARDYHAILEGILSLTRYGQMLARLRAQCPSSYFYYFDISLEETLRRHTTKPNAYEFGEAEMRAWYQPNDRTGFPGERIISESSLLTETVSRILAETGL